MFRARAMAAAMSAAAAASLSLAGGGATAAAAGPQGDVRLANVLPGLSHATDLGAADQATLMRVTISLAHPDPAGEAAAYRAIYDPMSPSYRHFLTPAQYQARFGVDAATATAARAWLQSGGLDVFYASPSNDLFEAQASVGRLDRLFATRVNRYRASDGTVFLANDTAPSVPAGLRISNVMGLNTLQRYMTPMEQSHESIQRVHSPSAPTPADCNISEDGVCVGGYTPQDYWALYDMPGNDQGQGQTIGVFMEGQTDSVIADLRTAEVHNKLPQVPVRVEPAPEPDKSPPPSDNGGAGEWDLDTQSSTGAAPLVSQVVLYDAISLSDADVTIEFSKWANDAVAPSEMNASFGECEANPGNAVFGSAAANPKAPVFDGLGDNVEPTTEAVLMQATVEGRTLFTSAGDTGGSCPAAYAAIVGAANGIANEGDPNQNYPCASQFAVCVGGTVLYGNVDSGGRAVSRKLEYAWTHGGGGTSGYIAAPDFQARYLPTGNAPAAPPVPCVVKYDDTAYPPGTFCRMTPDIAAQSGDVATNGFQVTFFGMPGQTGGTSLSSPLSMGMWARINAASPNPGGLGFADETIYPVASGTPGTTFDITAGSNVQRAAAPGFDETTGWGSFDVARFIEAADNVADPRQIQVSGSPAPVPAPATGDSVACQPLFVTWQGNATDPALNNNAPNLDIVSGSIGYDAAAGQLDVAMEGPDSSFAPAGASVSPGGAEGTLYVMDWTFGTTTYMAGAYVDPAGGTVSYFDGPAAEPLVVPASSDPSGFAAALDGVNMVSGSFTGGILTVKVPLADVGSPQVGSLLRYPMGITQEVNDPVLVPFTIDTGGAQNDYTVGQSCNGSTAPVLTSQPEVDVPEAPTAPLLVLAGGLGGTALTVRRRIRRRRAA